MNSKKRKEDETGYCKPPKSTQFKKGQSGNPKGRPKGTFNLASAFERAFQAFQKKVVITENGQQKTVTKLDAAFMQFSNKCTKGELPALKVLLPFATSIMRESRAMSQEKSDDYSEIKVQVNLFVPTEQIRARALARGVELPKWIGQKEET